MNGSRAQAAVPAVISVSLSGDRLRISGTGLASVESVAISGPGVDANLEIVSRSDSTLVTSAASQLKFALGGMYSLLVSTASAATPTSVLFQVEDASIGPLQLDRSYVVKTGDTMTGALTLPLNGLTVGTNQLVTTGGNVGIGTASPASLLDLRGSGSTSEIKLGVTAVGELGSILYNNAGDTSLTLSTNFSGNNNAIVLKPGNVEVLRALRSGNVGIGTTAPATKLDVLIDDASNASTTNLLTLSHSTSGAAGIGIGAGILFKTENASGSMVNMGTIEVIDVDAAAGSEDGNMLFKLQNNGTHTEKMRILHNGNVGIGTPTPATNSRLSIKDGHLQSQQTTAPAASAGAGSGTSGSCTLSNATDVAGSVSVVLGTAAWGTGSYCRVTFDKVYSTAPIVQLTPANAAAAQWAVAREIYVTSSTTGFDVNLGVAAAADNTFNYSYHVIETQ